MGKNFSTIKGDRKNRYFAEVLEADTSTEDKLERLCTEVSSAWVRNSCIPRGAMRGKASQPVEQTQVSVPPAPSAAVDEKVAPAEKSKRFDPFAIHTTNVFKKEGADGLRTALDRVAEAAHLKSMITAQRIPVSGLDKLNDAAALRASIVSAVEARISDRKAAAS